MEDAPRFTPSLFGIQFIIPTQTNNTIWLQLFSKRLFNCNIQYSIFNIQYRFTFLLNQRFGFNFFRLYNKTLLSHKVHKINQYRKIILCIWKKNLFLFYVQAHKMRVCLVYGYENKEMTFIFIEMTFISIEIVWLCT